MVNLNYNLEAVKVSNLRELCNSELAWYSLIVKVVVTCVKFLEPSGYCTVINYAFTFCATNIFGYFHCIMAQFEHIKP